MSTLRYRGTRHQGTRLAAGLAAAALLLSGCGGNEETTKTASPTTPRDQLLLSIEEFPEGASKIEMPADRLQAAVTDLSGIQQNSTITPAECGRTQQDLGAATSELLADSDVIAANDGAQGLMYVEFVASRAGDLAGVEESNTTCPEVTVVSTIEGKQITTVGKVETLGVPDGLNADEALAFKSINTSTVGEGKPLTTTAYQGMAVVRGVTVIVRVGALKEGVDQSTFDQVFLDAVSKVRNAD
ncbi:hypothetical protein [Nocardia shimofusensis]|uniref:hypothetical protein n=1 Tax=Nocardia shimofusensis TaxID=228596 RepID=UPI0012EEAE2B|nr:hypothetical protein [Nocardia shimofusensis]